MTGVQTCALQISDIENGKFSFIGEPGEIPVSANMIVVRKPNDTIYNGIVILESGNINFANNHGTYTSSGTFQNNLMANLQRVINETELQILELQHNGLGSTTDSVTAKIDSLINIKNNDIKNFIANSNDKSIGVALMSKYLDIMDEEEILTIITTAGPDFIKSPLYNKIKKRYQHMRKNRN